MDWTFDFWTYFFFSFFSLFDFSFFFFVLLLLLVAGWLAALGSLVVKGRSALQTGCFFVLFLLEHDCSSEFVCVVWWHELFSFWLCS